MNNAYIEPSIWCYAIHGNNPELISFLEDNHIEPDDKSFHKCLEESIKCHHNEMANYILNTHINNEDKNEFDKNVYAYAFHYHNYIYFPTDVNHKFIFFYACQYNYISIVEYFIKCKKININDTIV